MAIPACTAGADQSFAYSVSQAVTLAGAATGSPTAWEWRMLSVPSGSTDNVGTNGSFTNGVATVQNPSFTAHNPGCYVLQLKAQNGDGWSDPLIDKENGQTLVFIRTQKLNLEIPNFQAYRNDTSLLAALLLLEASSGSGTDADAIHDNVASEIVFITAKVTPNAEDIVVIEDKDDSFNKKKMFVSNLPMGSDRWLQRSSDTEYTETTETFTLKATFRVARNAGRKPIAWGVAVSAWSEVASGGKPEIRVDAVGSGGTDSVTLYTDQGMTETVYQSSFLITDAYEPTDDPVTINVYLRTTVAGDDAYMKLFELYAIVDTTGGLHGGGGGGG